MAGVQIRMFDIEGKEIFHSGGEKAFCGALKATGAGDKVCQEVRDKLLSQALSEGSAMQVQSACGNKYTVFPVRHQFENLGRVVLGPYQDTSLDAAKVQAIASKFRLDPVKFAQSYKEMSEVTPERLKKMARFMARFFDAFVFINAKRLITSLMHLELIMQSRDKIFQEIEKQREANPEDKREIEKLKSMF